MKAKEREWPRSRYWLAYFLHSRHERLPIDIDELRSVAASKPTAALLECLAAMWWRRGRHPWLVRDALSRHGDDPAYVQSLRLIGREELYAAGLLNGALVEKHAHRLGETSHFGLGGARRVLGWRFELSMRLLSDLVSTELLRLTLAQCGCRALRSAIDQVLTDKAAHKAFFAERLTLAYADFNFVRRNARRQRLRAMFACGLAWAVLKHAPLLAATGTSATGFARRCWRTFNESLEQMVPYKRDALLSALALQRHRPWGQLETRT